MKILKWNCTVGVSELNNMHLYYYETNRSSYIHVEFLKNLHCAELYPKRNDDNSLLVELITFM